MNIDDEVIGLLSEAGVYAPKTSPRFPTIAEEMAIEASSVVETPKKIRSITDALKAAPKSENVQALIAAIDGLIPKSDKETTAKKVSYDADAQSLIIDDKAVPVVVGDGGLDVVISTDKINKSLTVNYLDSVPDGSIWEAVSSMGIRLYIGDEPLEAIALSGIDQSTDIMFRASRPIAGERLSIKGDGLEKGEYFYAKVGSSLDLKEAKSIIDTNIKNDASVVRVLSEEQAIKIAKFLSGRSAEYDDIFESKGFSLSSQLVSLSPLINRLREKTVEEFNSIANEVLGEESPFAIDDLSSMFNSKERDQTRSVYVAKDPKTTELISTISNAIDNVRSVDTSSLDFLEASQIKEVVNALDSTAHAIISTDSSSPSNESISQYEVEDETTSSSQQSELISSIKTQAMDRLKDFKPNKFLDDIIINLSDYTIRVGIFEKEGKLKICLSKPSWKYHHGKVHYELDHINENPVDMIEKGVRAIIEGDFKFNTPLPAIGFGENIDQITGGRRNTKEVAKFVRDQIKSLQSSGVIHPQFKISVRKQDYNSVDVSITKVPEGFMLYNPLHVAGLMMDPHGNYSDLPPRLTHEAEYLTKYLGSVLNQFNYDNSDSMTDYFDRGYYGYAKFYYEVESEEYAKLVAVIEKGALEESITPVQYVEKHYANYNRFNIEFDGEKYHYGSITKLPSQDQAQDSAADNLSESGSVNLVEPELTANQSIENEHIANTDHIEESEENNIDEIQNSLSSYFLEGRTYRLESGETLPFPKLGKKQSTQDKNFGTWLIATISDLSSDLSLVDEIKNLETNDWVNVNTIAEKVISNLWGSVDSISSTLAPTKQELEEQRLKEEQEKREKMVQDALERARISASPEVARIKLEAETAKSIIQEAILESGGLLDLKFNAGLESVQEGSLALNVNVQEQKIAIKDSVTNELMKSDIKADSDNPLSQPEIEQPSEKEDESSFGGYYMILKDGKPVAVGDGRALSIKAVQQLAKSCEGIAVWSEQPIEIANIEFLSKLSSASLEVSESVNQELPRIETAVSTLVIKSEPLVELPIHENKYFQAVTSSPVDQSVQIHESQNVVQIDEIKTLAGAYARIDGKSHTIIMEMRDKATPSIREGISVKLSKDTGEIYLVAPARVLKLSQSQGLMKCENLPENTEYFRYTMDELFSVAEEAVLEVAALEDDGFDQAPC